MDAKEKTMAEQFRAMQAAAFSYMRYQHRKEAEDHRKEVMNKVFACLSEEEQKTMRSYMERIVEALKKEIGEDGADGEAGWGFPFGGGMGFDPRMGGFGPGGRRCGGHGHGHGHGHHGRMGGFGMPF